MCVAGGGGRLVVAAMLLALTAGAAAAQPAPDRQIWLQVLALGQLSDNWRTHIEVQPRWFDDGSELGLTIARAAIGRRLSPRVTAFGGYAWVPRTFGPGVRHEQRIWQQLSITGPALGAWATSARIRVEQRWLEPWDGLSHRLRMLARAQRAVGSGGWGLWAYDELMVTMDDTPRGPSSGYDRNRLAGGVSRRLSSVASIDAGYVWERATTGGAGRRDDHIAFGALNLSLPRR